MTIVKWLLACDVVYMDFIQDCSVLTVCSYPDYVSDILGTINLVNRLNCLLLQAYEIWVCIEGLE